MMDNTYVINQLRRANRALQLSLENREQHIERLQGDVQESRELIVKLSGHVKQLQHTQLHPGCGHEVTAYQAVTSYRAYITALEAENKALKDRNEWLDVYTVTPHV